MDKKRILFVDVNKASCESKLMVFGKYLPNYETEHFFYPEEAEKNLENTALIITGLYFPGDGMHQGGYYKGFEFYNKIKKTNPNIPVIINTNMPSTTPTFGKNKEIEDFLQNNLQAKDKFYEPKKSGVELLKIIKDNYNIR